MGQKDQLAEAKRTFEQVSAALEALPAAFVVYDADDTLLICNNAYKQQYHPCEDSVRPGVTHEELQWLKVREGLDERARGRAEAFVEDERRSHKTGPEIEEWQDDHGRHMRMLRARLDDGLTVGMRFDVTDLREAQLALETQNQKLEDARKLALEQATIDDLTGLTNRRAFLRELRDLEQQCRERNEVLAVLHIDLDGFKQVNDTFGHDAGDYILTRVGARLTSIVRETDLLARIGGDEFVLAMATGVQEDRPQRIAARLIKEVARPYRYEDQVCHVGASVGIAVTSHGDSSAEDLLKHADVALYKSKSDGRNRCTLFDQTLRETWEQKAEIGRQLSTANLGEQLEVFFQPIVDAGAHALASAEALVRWRHPTLGLLTPDKFLPLAEERRMVAEVDHCLLKKVLEARQTWLSEGLEVPKISVNVSSQRLCDPNLLPSLKRLDIPENSIAFEVLETVFAEWQSDVLKWNIEGLHEMGIELQIDDYGSSHSSISGLLFIRPSRLKIDQQFIHDLLENEQSREILRLTVALGHALGIMVTAEGIENLAQAECASKLDCDRLQGYYFGKPMSADVFRSLLLEARKKAV